MRVLIVEDEPYLADAMRDGLRLAAIAADVASDGRSALELVDENDYDVVVLDRDLPIIHGDDVARRITAEHPTTRIVMVTVRQRHQPAIGPASSERASTGKYANPGRGHQARCRDVGPVLTAFRSAHLYRP